MRGEGVLNVQLNRKLVVENLVSSKSKKRGKRGKRGKRSYPNRRLGQTFMHPFFNQDIRKKYQSKMIKKKTGYFPCPYINIHKTATATFIFCLNV